MSGLQARGIDPQGSTGACHDTRLHLAPIIGSVVAFHLFHLRQGLGDGGGQLPCQGWVVEVMMLCKQLANDLTPTGHGAPQAILQMGIMLGGQELRAHRQAKRLRGRLL